MLDQLTLNGIIIPRVRKHVLLELDRRLPESDLEQDNPQRVDVVDLGEHPLRLPLPLRVSVDVLRGHEVGGAGGEEGLGPAEVEAEDPGGGQVDFGFRGWEKEDVFAAETFMYLRVMCERAVE